MRPSIESLRASLKENDIKYRKLEVTKVTTLKEKRQVRTHFYFSPSLSHSYHQYCHQLEEKIALQIRINEAQKQAMDEKMDEIIHFYNTVYVLILAIIVIFKMFDILLFVWVL
jgi:hypothetical protein